MNMAKVQAKDHLLNALLELMNDYPVSAITVSELTKKAGVSRMTFYRNYTSIEHILTDRLQEVIDEYRSGDHFETSDQKMVAVQYVMHFLEFMKQHHIFVNRLIDSGMGELILKAVTDYEIRKWKCNADDIILICKIHLFAGGLYNLYVYWASKGFDIPAKELTQVVHEFCSG